MISLTGGLSVLYGIIWIIEHKQDIGRCPASACRKKSEKERPPLGGGWHGVSRDWGREPESFVYLRYMVVIETFSLPQSASLTAPSSEGAWGASAPLGLSTV